ncbi:MAG: hypothetical protein AAF988_05360 [Pseudomonadota bacterium]
MSKIEQAIDLIRLFAQAAEDEKLTHLEDLHEIEKTMSVAEQCEYAFAMAAAIKDKTTEEIEAQFGFNAIQLEYRPEAERQKLVNGCRNALVFKFLEEGVKTRARSVLGAVREVEIDPEDRALIQALAMTSKDPKSGTVLS